MSSLPGSMGSLEQVVLYCMQLPTNSYAYQHTIGKVPLSTRGRSPSRNLENLKSDHQDFLQKGGGDLNQAKFYFNVIDNHFFDIPLTHVKQTPKQFMRGH